MEMLKENNDEELLELGKYISKKTLCNLINAYQTMLPSALKAHKDFKINLLYSWSFVIDIIVTIITIGIAIWDTAKTVTLVLNVAPIDSTIQINSATYRNGTYRIHPGTYDVVVSHDGLDSKTFTLDLPANHSVTFSVFLKSGSDDVSFYENIENYSSYQKLAEIAGQGSNQTYDHDTSAEAFVTKFDKNYQLMQEQLPVEYYDYRDDPNASPRYTTLKNIAVYAGTECQKTLCLKIKVNVSDEKDFVTKLLKEKGFDLDLFEVQDESIH